ncbi:MAG: transcriptional regulator GlxA family with amidase domain [Flavobacteriales bacterium]|jgi:transcriptional regulator GlxA family with amidase domain
MPENKIENIDHQLSKIAFVLIPRFNMMTLTTMIETLRVANYLSPQPLYDWRYISFDGAIVTASNGLTIEAKGLDDSREDFDTVFVVGSWGCEHYDNSELFNWLRLLNLKGVQICGVELGVYALAKAKLLSQKVATTHWSCIAGFAELFPTVKLNEQLYTIDKNILTCSGGTAGIDLMLHLIGVRHGKHLKSEIAEQILHFPIREGSFVQRHTLGSSTESVPPIVYAAIKLIETNLAEPLKVPKVAREIGISQRQLERYFKRYMGCSFIQFSQLLRLQYARVLLTSTRMTVREASVASGFNSMSHFSYAFLKCFAKTPGHYRYAWSDTESAPSWPGTLYSFIETSRANAIRKAGASESESQ